MYLSALFRPLTEREGFVETSLETIIENSKKTNVVTILFYACLGKWDTGIFLDFYRENIILHGYTVQSVQVRPDDFDCVVDGAIVVYPGVYSNEESDRFLAYLDTIKDVKVILCGDESCLDFNTQILEKYPSFRNHFHPKYENVGFMPIGYAAHFSNCMAEHKGEHDWKHDKYSYLFAGCIHEGRDDRIEMRENIINTEYGLFIQTPLFGSGISIEEYVRLTSLSKIVMCPSGNPNVESFRPYEALECGCIPIVPSTQPFNETDNYWRDLLGEDTPMIVKDSWKDVGDTIKKLSEDKQFYITSNRLQSLWHKFKWRKYQDIVKTTFPPKVILGETPVSDLCTVIITTSPVKNNPDKKIIEKVVRSIRSYSDLKDCAIIITCDGCWDGHSQEMKDNYEKFKNNLFNLRRTNPDFHHTLVMCQDEWMHQAHCVVAALPFVTTPNILMMEHDCTLVGDIDVNKINNMNSYSNM